MACEWAGAADQGGRDNGRSQDNGGETGSPGGACRHWSIGASASSAAAGGYEHRGLRGHLTIPYGTTLVLHLLQAKHTGLPPTRDCAAKAVRSLMPLLEEELCSMCCNPQSALCDNNSPTLLLHSVTASCANIITRSSQPRAELDQQRV